MAAKITDRAISLHTISVPGYYRSETNSILMFTDKELSKYLQYGKVECAASDLKNSNKQHQFETK